MSTFPSNLRSRIVLNLMAVALALTLTNPALATWSIIVANPETGEVGIGSATCVSNSDLKKLHHRISRRYRIGAASLWWEKGRPRLKPRGIPAE